MRIDADRCLRLRPDLRRRRVRDVGRAGRGLAHLASTVVGVTTDDGAEGFGETLPARARLPAGARRGRAGRAARARARRCSGSTRASSAWSTTRWTGRCSATPTPRARSTSPAGTCSGSAGLPVCDAARRPAAGVATRSTSRSRSAPPTRWPRTSRARRARGRPPLPAQARRRPARRRRAGARRARGDDRRGRRDRRRQRRLARCRTRSSPRGCSKGSTACYFEQPCPTLEECLYVRQRTTLPMVLDEVITDVAAFLRACTRAAMEAINLKICQGRRADRARQLRDLGRGARHPRDDRGHLGRRPRDRGGQPPRGEHPARRRCSPSRS